MITLKTLAQATEQEVFDQVANHLLTQKIRSIKADNGIGVCAYRGSNNLQCAAGCLIADDEYIPKMDEVDKTWSGLVKLELVPRTIHDMLIRRLQQIHDNNPIENWHHMLELLADEYKLNWNFD
jgi:hypothetical protein